MQLKCRIPSTPVFDDKEAVEHLKPQCENGEEVEGGDYLAVVVQKRQPSFRFALVRSPLQTLQVARNRRFGNPEPELEQFAVDAWCAPCRIVSFHTPDQLADILMHLRSAWLPRSPPPKQTETSTMPGHHRFRFDQYKGVSPTRIESPQRRPEESVRAFESGSR